jgi:hypothetical protein
MQDSTSASLMMRFSLPRIDSTSLEGRHIESDRDRKSPSVHRNDDGAADDEGIFGIGDLIPTTSSSDVILSDEDDTKTEKKTAV